MDIRIKRKKTLLALLLVVSVLFSACGETKKRQSTDTDDIDELKAQIESLAAENEELKQQLEKFTAEEVSPQKRKWCGLRKPCRRKKQSRREAPQEDRLNIVVFGDSIWDMDRGIQVLLPRLLII